MANLIRADQKLIDNVYVQLGKRPIKFQFPPKITSDCKSGNWDEISIYNFEPFALFMGASARTFSLQWSYIVTNQNKWSAEQVANEVKGVRDYFYKQAMSKEMIVKLRIYNVVGQSGPSDVTFRGDSLDVSHSESLVMDNNIVYPLKTDLSLKLKFFLTLNDDGINSSTDAKKAIDSAAKAGADGKTPPQNFQGISDRMPPMSWR